MSPTIFTRAVGGLYAASAAVGLLATSAGGATPAMAAHPEQLTLAVGMIPASPGHHLIHLAIGLAAIVVCRSRPASVHFTRGLAVFMGSIAVVGLLPPGAASGSSLVLISTDGIWLHAVTALLAAHVGFAPTPRRPPKRISGTAVPA